MRSNTFPSIQLTHELGSRNESNFKSYATLLLSFLIKDNLKKPIILNNFNEAEEYPDLIANIYLMNIVKAYFANYGNRLYIIAQPSELIVHNMAKYTHFLEINCDNIKDIETVIAIDVFEQEFSIYQVQNIQNTISEYCNNSHLISISDLPKKNFAEYSTALYDTVSFYPWIEPKDSDIIIPASIYAAALCSSVANLNGVEETIANKYIEYIGDTHIKIDDSLLNNLNSLHITPLTFERSQGYNFGV